MRTEGVKASATRTHSRSSSTEPRVHEGGLSVFVAENSFSQPEAENSFSQPEAENSFSHFLVLDSSYLSEYFYLKTQLAFENVLVHMMEPVIYNDLLQEERAGPEPEDHDVHATLSKEPAA